VTLSSGPNDERLSCASLKILFHHASSYCHDPNKSVAVSVWDISIESGVDGVHAEASSANIQVQNNFWKPILVTAVIAAVPIHHLVANHALSHLNFLIAEL